MSDDSLAFIFLNTCIINNFVLSAFLGVCPFIGASGKLETASRMGIAVLFVMLVTSVCAYFTNALLVALGLEYLRLICYVAVIATAVQIVQMALKRHNPALYRALGLYLPLVTTNCAILGLALLQTGKGYNFFQCLAYAAGSGAGFTLVLVLMAGLREQLALNDLSGVARGSGLALMLAGILSLAFMGFAGLGN
jgi:electron transport complex protein RnfA